MHIGNWGCQLVSGEMICPFKDRELDSSMKVINHLKQNSIQRAVVVPTYTPERQLPFRTNDLVLETAMLSAGVVVPGFWVDPSPDMQNELAHALRKAEQNGVRVLKTSADAWDANYTPDPNSWDRSFTLSMDMILDFLRQRKAILQIHTGSKKSQIRFIEMLLRHAGPEVRFHLVHMGNSVGGHFYLVPRLRSWIDEGLQIICDSSLAKGFAVRWLIELAILDQKVKKCLVFASDEPWGSFQSEYAKIIDAVGNDQELLRDVLWSNAYNAYCT